MPAFDLIGFDADDTLWQNERYYNEAQTRFAQLLSHYHPEEWVRERLYETETRNIQHFGYGVKAFALSMIETAVELTEGRISGQDIKTLVEVAREMLDAEVELLPQVREAIHLLAKTHRLALITKGDLLDQERKIERSGLGQYFQDVEIVSHKTPAAYAQFLKKLSIPAERFLMVGNSLRSDILPVLQLGGSAVHIPYGSTWQHEQADTPPMGTPGFQAVSEFGQIPTLIALLEQA